MLSKKPAEEVVPESTCRGISKSVESRGWIVFAMFVQPEEPFRFDNQTG